MSRRARWNHTPGFKAEVATKGDEALSEPAGMFDVQANQIRAGFGGDGQYTRRGP